MHMDYGTISCDQKLLCIQSGKRQNICFSGPMMFYHANMGESSKFPKS